MKIAKMLIATKPTVPHPIVSVISFKTNSTI